MNPDINFDTCPERYREALRMYIIEGYDPGGFLIAVLESNLFDAYGLADRESQELMPELIRWIYNEAPSLCWGSPSKVSAWVSHFWGKGKIVARVPGRLDDGSNEEIADREEFDAHELNV